MKLFRVEVSKVLYIVSESEEEAALDADRYSREDDNSPDVSVTEATRKGIRRDGWEGALIYGGSCTKDQPAIEAVKLND